MIFDGNYPPFCPYDRLRSMRSFPALLAFTDGDVWRPGIGDPTVMGWVTVLAYFVVAFLCGRCAVRAKNQAGRTEMIFWGVLVVTMVLLGFNKQLDLQTFLTLTVRKVAIAQGWYDNRRVVQLAFVGLVAIAGVGGLNSNVSERVSAIACSIKAFTSAISLWPCASAASFSRAKASD